ncbi:phage tail protein [Paenibacillus sp. GCM10023252]|uniref:phage tail protein n=1 Tax=Paenibacillus sp. GCM10023252 TaxID=3252649 RepID=UPI00360A9E9B
MAEAYIGEIRIFGGNYEPKGWAFCNGQLLSIAQNTALFSILGTQYGGDGKVTFALPNLMGAAPMGQGQGPGLTERFVGEMTGTEKVTLTELEIPAHSHQAVAYQNVGGLNDPTNHYWGETPASGRPPQQVPMYGPTPNVPMSSQALQAAGGSQAHNNMQPFLAMNYIICMQGEFPSRG